MFENTDDISTIAGDMDMEIEFANETATARPPAPASRPPKSTRSTHSALSPPHLHIPDDISVSSLQSSLSPSAPRSIPASCNRRSSTSSTSSTQSRHPTRTAGTGRRRRPQRYGAGCSAAQVRRRSAAGYRDRILAALEASEEADRRAEAREEARDQRDDRMFDALLEEMRAGTNLLREAVGVMREMAAASAARSYRRRSRSRSPIGEFTL